MKTRERIDITMIDDNPWQPRQEIEPTTLEKLADSIRGVGLLQAPLGRRTEDGRIQLAFGHRRVAACKVLSERSEWGPCIDMDLDDELTDEDMAVMALSENVARRQLTQIEVVRAHRRALDETGLSIESLAEKLGVSRSALSNNLRVLNLPDFVLAHVESGGLRVSVAREFLVLQNATHCHAEDMQAVITSITNNYRVQHQGALPNWSRRNVRSEIAERVASNEKDFRPLGPRVPGRGGHYQAGDARETTFDVEAFSADRPHSLHTIPVGESSSRVWTCDVKEWRRRQTQATREANQAAEVSGTKPGSKSGASAAPSRDKQFEQALAQDPVFKTIKAGRTKTGPNRPVTDEELAALGTRAELRDVDYSTKFWKILSKGNPSNIRDWQRQDGGHVPPYFPLEECGNCTVGAAYAKSRQSYILDKVTLVCMNRKCYQDKCGAGGSRYREELEDHKLDVQRRDAQMARQVNRELEALSAEALRTLATVILSAGTKLDWQHPLGEPIKKWSWETGVVARICDLLRAEKPIFEQWGRRPYGHVEIDADSLQDVADGDLRDLVANLVAHHLRQAGKMDTIAREPVPADGVDPMELRRLLGVSQETVVADKR